MNKYEMAVVVNGKLEEDAKNAVLDKVKALIERFGGTIKNVDEWGKKRFAYEIQKSKEGYYNFIKFEAESTAPAEIEHRMRIMDGVVRYLIVTDDLPENIGIKKEEAPASEDSAEEATEAAEESETEEA
ncbi:MAG: 30S ribosomal protein S6 [Lachnospiraceae bacterium]|nr:30S ribosomal protein S6 [Lachnospiraceae bacterium]